VLRINGDGSVDVIPTGFGPGRLVAVAAAPSGTVYAAERGGAGRLLRIDPGRPLPQVVASFAGAEFYGLTIDGSFLYALDLRGRQLLRFPLTGEAPATEVVAEEAESASPAVPPPTTVPPPAATAVPPATVPPPPEPTRPDPPGSDR